MSLMDEAEEKIYGRTVIDIEYHNPRTQSMDAVELVLFSTGPDALTRKVFWGYRYFNGAKHTMHIFRDIKTAGEILNKFFEEMGLSGSYYID